MSNRLTRQQRYTLQYKAALDNYLNSAAAAESEQQEINDRSTFEIKNPPIKAWSSPPMDSQVSLPLTKTKSIETKSLSQPKQVKPNTSKTSEWPAPAISQSKTSKNKKPHSLSGVKLPRFPRQ